MYFAYDSWPLRRPLVALLTATLGALVSCAAPDPPEQRLRAVIAAAERGAEARDLGEVMELVADSYGDERGFNKAQLRDFVRGYFVLNQKVDLIVNIEEIQLPATRLAQVRVSVGALGRRAGVPTGAGFEIDLNRFDLEFIDEQGHWRLRRADSAGP